MATYLELFGLASNSNLQDRATVAVVKAAQSLLSGTPTVDQAKWSAAVIRSPRSWGDRILQVVLAANSNNSVAQITGATDAQLQSVVDGIIDAIVVAYAAEAV